MRIKATSIAICLCSISSLAIAGPETSKDCSVSVDPPAGWVTRAKGNDLVMEDPKREALVLLVCSDRDDTDEVLKGLDKLVGASVKDIRMEKGKVFEVNGLKGIISDGAGSSDVGSVSLSVAIVKTHHHKGLVAFAAVKSDRMKDHAGEIVGMFKTLRPAR